MINPPVHVFPVRRLSTLHADPTPCVFVHWVDCVAFIGGQRGWGVFCGLALLDEYVLMDLLVGLAVPGQRKPSRVCMAAAQPQT